MTHAVHFGAGNIGRGFIADLLHTSGYDITFLDVNTKIVDEINESGSFTLRLIDHDYQKKVIDRVAAIAILDDAAAAVTALRDADLITTSVWANNLPRIAPLLADGLLARETMGRPKVNVIACENAMFASSTLRQAILDTDRGISTERLDTIAAFPNTAVDRVVLEGQTDGHPTVDVADYFELAVEQPALAVPDVLPIAGATYSDDLEKFLVRKLYVVNCGHLWAGLLAYQHGIDSVRDVFVSETLVRGVREAMTESAAYVGKKYGFDARVMSDYVDLSVRRYQAAGVDYNTAMVTRSPLRKLAPDDRLVGPANGCEQSGLPNDRLLEGIAMLLHLDRADDEQSVELQQYISAHGASAALEHYAGVPRGSRLNETVMGHYDRLSHQLSH